MVAVGVVLNVGRTPLAARPIVLSIVVMCQPRLVLTSFLRASPMMPGDLVCPPHQTSVPYSRLDSTQTMTTLCSAMAGGPC